MAATNADPTLNDRLDASHRKFNGDLFTALFPEVFAGKKQKQAEVFEQDVPDENLALSYQLLSLDKIWSIITFMVEHEAWASAVRDYEAIMRKRVLLLSSAVPGDRNSAKLDRDDATFRGLGIKDPAHHVTDPATGAVRTLKPGEVPEVRLRWFMELLGGIGTAACGW